MQRLPCLFFPFLFRQQTLRYAECAVWLHVCGSKSMATYAVQWREQKEYRRYRIDMPSQQIIVSNQLGLHARASAKLCKLAGSFPCEVTLARGERSVNAKSIMGVMLLAAGIGTELTLTTSGEQEDEALAAIAELFQRKFDEGQ